jgi:hypothetical protein
MDAQWWQRRPQAACVRASLRVVPRVGEGEGLGEVLGLGDGPVPGG